MKGERYEYMAQVKPHPDYNVMIEDWWAWGAKVYAASKGQIYRLEYETGRWIRVFDEGKSSKQEAVNGKRH